MEKVRKHNIADIIFISLLSAFIVIFGILIFVLPQKDFSEKENRTLQKFPTPDAKSVASGEYTMKIGDFYADQFPFRNFFTSVKFFCEQALLKGENNGVIIGKDGYLIEKCKYTDENYDYLETNLSAMDAFEKNFSGEVSVAIAIAPRAIDVLTDKLPSLYRGAEYEKVWDYIDDAGYGKISDKMRKEFSALSEAGEDVWYKNDHHWTTLGAYYAYVMLSEELGYDPYPFEFFKEELASDQFFGTSYSSSEVFGNEPDDLLFFRFDGDTDYTTTISDTGKSFDGFYDRSFLEVKDKYSSFIGGNNGLVYIKKNGEEREKLMIVKDSFAHSLAPFLALHYDLVIVDTRYYKSPVSELVGNEGIKKILILCNADSLATSDFLKILMLGIQ